MSSGFKWWPGDCTPLRFSQSGIGNCCNSLHRSMLDLSKFGGRIMWDGKEAR